MQARGAAWAQRCENLMATRTTLHDRVALWHRCVRL